MAARQRPARFNADQVLVRGMHYRDNDKLLYSDDEEDIDRQLLGIDDDSREDSSSDDDETAGFTRDFLKLSFHMVLYNEILKVFKSTV